MTQRILVIDDEADIRLILQKFLQKNDFETYAAEDGVKGLKIVEEKEPHLVICDFKLPDITGIELLKKIKAINPGIHVIIITGYSDVRIAVDALKKGAFDYVTKPLYPEEILLTVKKALSQKNASPVEIANSTIETKSTAVKKSSGNALPDYTFISGDSDSSLVMEKHINLIAPTDMSVIILGETGTGKEYVAREIHNKSKRSSNPFIAVDCGALTNELAASELFGHVKGAFTGAMNDKKGCFEFANGGTLFLDELGNLSYDNQIKLLRVLQEKSVKPVGSNKSIPIDVRVVVATNENLAEGIQDGSFREDIYHRLNEFSIQLKPLRERKDDIKIFSKYFIEQSNIELGKDVKKINNKATTLLQNYYWHGNIRELKNVIKRAVLMCDSDTIDEMHLPIEIIQPEQFGSFNQTSSIGSDLKSIVEHAEKKAIVEALKQTNNNKSKTADLLKVDRKTLYNKINAYKIDL